VPEIFAFDSFVSIISVATNVVLTLFIISLSINQINEKSNEEYDNLKRVSFVVNQELNKIFQVIFIILKNRKTEKKFYYYFYISDSWRENIGFLAPYLPYTVITDLFRLYSFCELSNENKLDFSKYENFAHFKDFIEVNNIEFVSNSFDSIIIANSNIRFFDVFFKHINSNKKVKILGNNHNQFIKGTDALVNNKDIKRFLVSDIIGDFKIESLYENSRIKHQMVIESEITKRNCIYDENGYASGLDSYAVDENKIYSYFYRRGEGIKINFGSFYSKDSKYFKYEGEIKNDKLNGSGKIYKNGKLYSEGEYLDGRLINGKLYDVEINRVYQDKKLQDQYDYQKYVSSDDYIEQELESQEAYYENMIENDYHYISVKADYIVEDGNKIMLEKKEEKVLLYDSEDI
jgi:hypothetical protein